MAISLRLSKSDDALFRKYAEMNRMSVSEMIRQTVLEKIEDEYDVKEYEQALAEYEADPKTYSLSEMEKELGLR